jgi:NADPH:quinone reductase-like Zn-dependent oxidoreductase
MKCYHANPGAGLEGLTLKHHDEPRPGPREVLLRVRANSLNFRELSVLRGTYPLPVKPDVVMGADGAGEVVALSEGVTRVKAGDRVAAAMFPRWIDEFVGTLEKAESGLDIHTLYTAIARLRVVAAGNRAQFMAMNRAIAVAKLKPVIDRIFSFDELKAAFRYYESDRPLGKVVIRHE